MKKIKFNKIYIIVSSLIFAIFIVIGNSFQRINSWSLVFSRRKTLYISFIKIIIWTILIDIAINIIILIFKWYYNKKLRTGKINKIFNKHTFLISIVVMLIGWAIYIVAFYPTVITIDAYGQLKQFFGLENYYSDTVVLLSEDVLITNHHPVLHTMMLGTLLKLGRACINDNFGLFLYSIIQIGILASVLAYTIKYLKKNGAKNRFLYIILFIYALVPVFPFYAMTATKDVIYTALIILYIIEIHKIVKNNKEELVSYKKVISLILLSIAICLARNNGIGIVLITWFAILFYSKSNRKRIGIILITIVLISVGYTKLILPLFKIQQTSKREILSIPFQQTARYIRTYEKEVTGEEKKVINKVLNYEKIKEVYNPNNSDPVKNTYNKYASNEDIKQYFKVWIKEFFKHPGVYIQATINNTYGYFYPSLSLDYIYYQDVNNPMLNLIANHGYRNFKERFMDYHYNDNMNNVRIFLVKGAKAFQHIPILGGIVNIAINNWIVILMIGYICQSKKKRNLIILLPSILSIIICIISPVNNYFRYAMPVIFSNPVITMLIINEGIKKEQ